MSSLIIDYRFGKANNDNNYNDDYINEKYNEYNTSIRDSEVKQRDNELKMFKNIYGNQIEYTVKPIFKSLKKIIPNNYDVNIIINNFRNSESNIYVDKRNSKDNKIVININYEQMNIILNENNQKIDINIMDCFTLLLTHEYFHFLNLHLSNSRIRTFRNFSLGKNIDRNDKLYDNYNNYNNFSLKNIYNNSLFNIYRGNHKFILNENDSFYNSDIISIINNNNNNNNSKNYDCNEFINRFINKYKVGDVIFNIACDLYINEALNAPNPLLRAKNFKLPRKLTDFEYYSLIMILLNYKDEDNGEKYDNICSKAAWGYEDNNVIKFIYNHYKVSKSLLENYIKYIKEKNNKDIIIAEKEVIDSDNINFDSMCSYDRLTKYNCSEILSKELNKLSKSTLAEKSHDLIEIMNVSKSGIWKDFKLAINSIKKNENDKKLSLNKYTQDWTKFNNRKIDKYSESSNLIYPGRKSTKNKNGNIFSQENNAILFIDISGSMSSVIEPLYTFCYIVLKQLDLKIVLYDTKICKIINGFKNLDFDNDNFFLGGGTNTENSVNEYIEKYGKFKNLYVVSDCYDNTLNNLEIKFGKNCKIFELKKNSLKERGK